MTRRKKTKAAPFIMFQYRMLNSEAFKSLPPTAAKALLLFLAKVKIGPKFDEHHREVFQLPYGELQRFGFAKQTCTRVIIALISIGFVDPVEKGGLRGHGKTVNKFKLSRRWEQYGQAGFVEKDWRSFGS